MMPVLIKEIIMKKIRMKKTRPVIDIISGSECCLVRDDELYLVEDDNDKCIIQFDIGDVGPKFEVKKNEIEEI